MTLSKNQIKRLGKLYAANLIRMTDYRLCEGLDTEEQALLKSELNKIADRIHLKKYNTFLECYEAIVNDNFNILREYSRRK